MRGRRSRLALILLLLAAGAREATAQDWGVDGDRVQRPPAHWANLRAGGSSGSENGRPELCLELAPLTGLSNRVLAAMSVEACGTGSGILHHDPDPETVSFRVKWQVGSWRRWGAWFQPQLGAGFAEVQIGEDTPGFYFSSAGPDGVETAGPEAGVHLRVLFPIGRFELVGELHLSAAYFEHAPELARPLARFQPELGASVGFGF
jgi:hypothetical protein